MDEVDMMRLAIRELEEARRLKRMNDELLEQLTGWITWLFRYSERNHIPLPDKESVYRIVEKASFLIDQIAPDKVQSEVMAISNTRRATPRQEHPVTQQSPYRGLNA